MNISRPGFICPRGIQQGVCTSTPGQRRSRDARKPRRVVNSSIGWKFCGWFCESSINRTTKSNHGKATTSLCWKVRWGIESFQGFLRWCEMDFIHSSMTYFYAWMAEFHIFFHQIDEFAEQTMFGVFSPAGFRGNLSLVDIFFLFAWTKTSKCRLLVGTQGSFFLAVPSRRVP